MKQATNPVVLITGASRGLGRGIAFAVAEMGCSVVVNYVKNESAAQETVKLCAKKKTGGDQRFVPLRADISSRKGRASLLSRTLDEFGRIDALVNNAGIPPAVKNDITTMTEESFDEVLATNLRGPHFLTQAVANRWLADRSESMLPGGRKIIFVSSVSAELVSLNRGEYCISKAGVAMVAKLWAVRLAPAGIQVFELRPGIMATDMTSSVKEKYDAMIARGDIPQGRWGTAEDVGLAVKALLANTFPFSTGAVINIDGGLTMERL